jgi:CBS domain-containing protein
MNISEVMTSNVRVVSPQDTLQYAAQLMEETDAGLLPVSENDELIGTLTDRDITIRAVAKGLPPDETYVSDVMSADAMYVFDDQSIEEAAQDMSDFQVRRLPVLNRDNRLVGIVALADLARNQDDEVSGLVLNRVSQPN